MIWENPIEIGHWVGFKDLTALHNKWLRSFLYNDNDQTLQAHRGSYKTTTLSLFFAIHAVIKPNETLLYFRKTGTDVVEISRQTANILNSSCMKRIAKILYNKELELIKESGMEIQTNLSTTIKGTSQIVGLGIGTSITGKHADIVVTDDIVNIKDRISTAEREKTKISYMELQNIKNRNGRFINTGTPWHKDDCFSLMQNFSKYDCYSTRLMSQTQIDILKASMSPSLFAANYELKHIAAENLLFSERPMDADISNITNTICQIDCAYGGEDYTAFTAMSYHDGHFYIYGKCWQKHIEDCYDEIVSDYRRLMFGKCFVETNADKGMIAKDMKRKFGMRMVSYHEATNKHIKISTYLKAIWEYVIFVTGTDAEYINQILDYTEDAEHDDCPDSAAVLARRLYKKANININVDLNDEVGEYEN